VHVKKLPLTLHGQCNFHPQKSEVLGDGQPSNFILQIQFSDYFQFCIGEVNMSLSAPQGLLSQNNQIMHHLSAQQLEQPCEHVISILHPVMMLACFGPAGEALDFSKLLGLPSQPPIPPLDYIPDKKPPKGRNSDPKLCARINVNSGESPITVDELLKHGEASKDICRGNTSALLCVRCPPSPVPCTVVESS
jgi:hypothetical protein